MSNYVQFDDYATNNKTGVINGNINGFQVSSSGNPYAKEYTEEEYDNVGNQDFIGKGTLENAKDKIVGSSTPVQDLNTNLDNVVSKNTASGEVVSFDDAVEYKTFNVTVDGASEQETTTDANLLSLDVTPTSNTNAGVTMTFDKDKQILTFDGTIPAGQTSNYQFTFNEPLVIEPVEEYPEYVKPTGAHDSYNIGDKITYNGKHYECIFDGCVWNPDEYPQGWEEIIES